MSYEGEELAKLRRLREVLATEHLVLKGNKYKGRFFGEQKVGVVTRGSEYSEHEEDRFYWKGQGMVTTPEGAECRFLFSTWDK